MDQAEGRNVQSTWCREEVSIQGGIYQLLSLLIGAAGYILIGVNLIG
jgi:hypothetical protein